MQIDNTRTWSIVQKNKVNVKLQLNVSKHVREKSGKLCISIILSSKIGITPTRINANWRHSNLSCSTVKQSHMKKSAQYVKECESKMRKTVYLQYSKFQKGHNSYNNWHKSMTLKIDL